MKMVLCASAAVMALGGAAYAQSVDYATYEALFGEPVTLSATGTAKRASEAPASVTIITAEEIRRSGARDIAELLDRVAGVEAARGGAGSPEVAIRGFNKGFSRRLLVLLDGRQVYSDFFTFTTWSTIPVAMDEIRQIEIVRGPAVALYGLNAVGGAVNIVTYGVNEKTQDSFEIRAGSDAYVEGQAVLSRQLTDTLSARLSLRAAQEDQFEEPLNPVFEPARRDPERFRARARLGWTPSDTLGMEIDASFATTEQTDYIGIQEAGAGDVEVGSLRFSASWRPGKWTFSADAYVNELEHDIDSFNITGFQADSRLIVGALEGSRRVTSKLTMRSAFEYRRTSMNTSPVDTGEVSFDLFAGSLVADYRVNDKLTLTGAARVDHINYDLSGTFPAQLPYLTSDAQDFTKPGVNAALVYQATDRDILKAIYGRGASLPSLVEIGAFQQITPIPVPGAGVLEIAVAGDPRIDPSVTDNFELRYERALAAVDGTLTLAGFYQIIRGEVFTPVLASANPANGFSALFNGRDDARADAFGGEVDIKARMAGFRLSANYGYVNIDEDDHDNTNLGLPLTAQSLSGNVGDTTSSLFEDFTSRHQINLSAGRDFGRLSFDLFGGWRSRAFTQVNDPISVYVREPIDGRAYLGGRLAFRLVENLTASVNVNDALDDRQTEAGAFRAERRWFAALRYSW